MARVKPVAAADEPEVGVAAVHVCLILVSVSGQGWCATTTSDMCVLQTGGGLGWTELVRRPSPPPRPVMCAVDVEERAALAPGLARSVQTLPISQSVI